jgi:hypothetical protein
MSKMTAPAKFDDTPPTDFTGWLFYWVGDFYIYVNPRDRDSICVQDNKTHECYRTPLIEVLFE